jgi:hypothetical protein
MKVARAFIERKTANADPNELIVFAGDFNANGQKDNRKAKAFKEQLKHRPDYDKLLDELENEYSTMISLLSKNGEDRVVDCAKVGNNGECPITYADVV